MASGGSGEYRIVVARSARKELEALPSALASRVLRKIEGLSSVPRPSGYRKLAGSVNLWRIRVGDYRVLYSVDDPQRLVDIIAVRHRGDAYR